MTRPDSRSKPNGRDPQGLGAKHESGGAAVERQSTNPSVAMTNPASEVEGLVSDLRASLPALRASVFFHVATNIEKAIDRLTHPLPDGEAGEREKVVAFLRERAAGRFRLADEAADEGARYYNATKGAEADDAADAIERGDHLTTSEPRT